MIKVLFFATLDEANARNHAEAVGRGCTGVTLYWWPMIEYQGQWGLVVGDDPVLEGETVTEIEWPQ